MRRKYTEEERRVLIEMYPTAYAKDIAKRLGRSLSSVYCQAAKLGLKAPIEKVREAGRLSSNHPNCVASRFKTDHVPMNKGKKVTADVYAKIKPTMFKKGSVPVNYRHIGSERITKDGYVEVKVADPGTWRLKQRLVWESANGPIPEGHAIRFRNGNKQDCSLENLYLISRADLMKSENSMYARYPEELRQVIRLKGAIKRQIRKNKRYERSIIRSPQGSSVRDIGGNQEPERQEGVGLREGVNRTGEGYSRRG